jgi:dipeptidyl aminopeptidase/acylaminoacyl peptidase
MKTVRATWITLLLGLTFAGANLLGQDAGTNASSLKLFRDRVDPHWFDGNNKFWYRIADRQRGNEFIVVDAARGTRGPAFDHERVATALGELTGQKIKAEQLPFNAIKISDDGKSVKLIGDKTTWQCDLTTYRVAETTAEPADKSSNPSTPAPRGGNRFRRNATAKSPDGKWEAFVRNHNLFLRTVATREERALTSDGTAKDSYARDVQRDRAVDMRYDTPNLESEVAEVYWSPDSHRLVAMRTKPGTQRTVYLVESSPKDQLQPKLQSYPYLKPGDDVPIRKPHLFEVDGAKEISVDNSLFANPWSIGDLRWSNDSARFTFLFNQRGHQALRILAVDSKSGDVKPIVDEESKTFVDYSGKFFAEYLDDTNEILWMSERDGWNHLYLYDSQSGAVKNQVTQGEWLVRGVDRVDREKRQIWFRAGGIRPKQDPYFIHYCRVNFDGTGLTVLTEGDGTHTVQFSPDRRFMVDTWSRVDLAPVNELRRCDDGRLVCALEQTDASELRPGQWHGPERFVAKARDGETEIFGVIHRPKDFDPKKKYPVIESIYAGPQDSFVPKSFRTAYPQDGLTRRGFIVVQMDGMGTSNRSKKFHDVCWKNLGDAGFPDRILWITAAAAKYPEMDLSRVGIYGTSAGGQNALGGILTHGDFYKVCVADCGCHDNRMDKIWWNEQWMGWPVGPHYSEQSNVTLAGQLQGKLLLMVGEMDRNVDPASTMQVVNALINADKDFDFLVMPGRGHGVAGTPYGRRRLQDFFVRHLGGDNRTTSSIAAR